MIILEYGKKSFLLLFIFIVSYVLWWGGKLLCMQQSEHLLLLLDVVRCALGIGFFTFTRMSLVGVIELLSWSAYALFIRFSSKPFADF